MARTTAAKLGMFCALHIVAAIAGAIHAWRVVSHEHALRIAQAGSSLRVARFYRAIDKALARGVLQMVAGAARYILMAAVIEGYRKTRAGAIIHHNGPLYGMEGSRMGGRREEQQSKKGSGQIFHFVSQYPDSGWIPEIVPEVRFKGLKLSPGGHHVQMQEPRRHCIQVRH